VINRFFEQVGGIVRVRLQGKNLEKIINMALARGIFINDVKRKEDGLHFKIRSSAYQALKSITEENGYELEVTEKKGMPFYQALLKRRLGFVVGALIFTIALYFLSSFVWFIEVSGTKQVDPVRVLVTAARYGLYQGAAKWDFSRTEAEEGLLRDINQLTYAKIEIRGVKARIEVVEKVMPREEIIGPCHLVAARDGIVEQVLVLDGQANVAAGDVVASGDILISGVVFPEVSPYIVVDPEQENSSATMPYTVRARGQVEARVWYEGYGECALVEEKTISGREATQYYLETPWKDFSWPRHPQQFALAEKEHQRKTVYTPLGSITLHKVKDIEQIKKVSELSPSEAEKIAIQRAQKALRNKIGQDIDSSTITKEVISSPSEQIIRVKLTAEMREDIAVPEPISGAQHSQR
jgi:similar to stage IV sporulation protein